MRPMIFRSATRYLPNRGLTVEVAQFVPRHARDLVSALAGEQQDLEQWTEDAVVFLKCFRDEAQFVRRKDTFTRRQLAAGPNPHRRRRVDDLAINAPVEELSEVRQRQPRCRHGATLLDRVEKIENVALLDGGDRSVAPAARVNSEEDASVFPRRGRAQVPFDVLLHKALGKATKGVRLILPSLVLLLLFDAARVDTFRREPQNLTGMFPRLSEAHRGVPAQRDPDQFPVHPRHDEPSLRAGRRQSHAEPRQQFVEDLDLSGLGCLQLVDAGGCEFLAGHLGNT